MTLFRSSDLQAELIAELRRQADDDINRTEWDGAAAVAYENALALVESYLPRIHSAAFRQGAKKVADIDNRATSERATRLIRG